ncbi:MAG: hypothetical protein K0U12_01550 [Gammaproteobacteria bacterium]|nr:hypothetical protein [Gammaproteobacteria bacterium]
MITKLKKLSLILGCLFPLVSFGYQYYIELTTYALNRMHLVWYSDGGTFVSDIYAQNGSAYFTSSQTEKALYEDAIRPGHADYVTFWNLIANVNGSSWPLYHQVKAKGGRKDFPMHEG